MGVTAGAALVWEAEEWCCGSGLPHHPASPPSVFTLLTGLRNRPPSGTQARASPAAASLWPRRSEGALCMSGCPRTCFWVSRQQPPPNISRERWPLSPALLRLWPRHPGLLQWAVPSPTTALWGEISMSAQLPSSVSPAPADRASSSALGAADHRQIQTGVSLHSWPGFLNVCVFRNWLVCVGPQT